jgi:hypothetical protein
LKKAEISSFIKILPEGAELLHADGRTEMTKLTATFQNVVNAPKIIMAQKARKCTK